MLELLVWYARDREPVGRARERGGMYSSFWEMISWRQPPQVLCETRDGSTLTVRILKKKDKYFIDGKRASYLQCVKWFADHGSAADNLVMMEVEAGRRKKAVSHFGAHLLVISDLHSPCRSENRSSPSCGYFIVSNGKARRVDRKGAEGFLESNPAEIDYLELEKFMRGERDFM
jgi:hypothetical protein